MLNKPNGTKGFTLFEIGIVLLLLALFLQAVWLVTANVYSYVSHTGQALDAKNEAYRVFVLIKKDIRASSGFAISSDNSTLKIYRAGGSIEYYLDKNHMVRKTASGEQILSKQAFNGIIWARDKNILTVCLSVPYKGYGKTRHNPIRIMENIETGGAR